MPWKRYCWLGCTAALILAYAVVSFGLRPGPTLYAVGDITPFLLLCLASAVMVSNAVSNRGQVRVFWSLMAAGCVMWAVNMALWILYEVVWRRAIPDPFPGDIVLFLHIVPFMAAVALRPHRPPEEHKLYSSTLNLLMLLVWWVLLYAFIVFPDEYVVMNVAVYSRNSDRLYLVENLALLGILGVLACTSIGAWKKIYWNLLVAAGLYTVGSETMDAAIARGQYHTGSIYDIPFIASICWLVWTGLLAKDLKPAYQITSAAQQAVAVVCASLGDAGYPLFAGDGVLGVVWVCRRATPPAVPDSDHSSGFARARMLRLHSAISSRSGVDAAARRVQRKCGKPAASAHPTCAEGETGVTGTTGGRRRSRDQ